MRVLLVICALSINLCVGSECIVSQWGTWSRCYGGCTSGLVVRNRDVVRPPLAELTADGKSIQKLCPHLYETRYCDPNVCKQQGVSNYQPIVTRRFQESTTHFPTTSNDFVNRATNLVEMQMKKVGLGVSNEDQKTALRNKFISETEQLFQLDEALNQQFGHSTSNIDSVNPTINLSTRQLTNQQWRNEMAATRPRKQEYTTPQISNSSVEPIKHTQRRSKPTSDQSINVLLRRIEQSLDSKKPLDEKYIRNALRRNQKLSKVLVDAYRQKTTASTSTTTQAPTTPLDTVTSSTLVPMMSWPKTGYIPNSRKHASEITSQLYMTNEIVQKIDDDQDVGEVNPECEYSKRCCKIEKQTCSDGGEVKYVKRWYRPKGASQCIPYRYPRCSSNDEMQELPIVYEQNCQDLCFGKQEKRISPLFTIDMEEEYQ